MKLRGAKVWLVGASSGIGAELAGQLADAGASVAISARRREQLDEVARGRMSVVPVDVTDLDGVKAAAGEVREALGGLDVVVFNAGTWEPVKVDAFSSVPFQKSFDINVMGLVHCVEAVLPAMRVAHAGRIVGVASVAGYRGMPNASAYGPTKAAMINLLESLRCDLGPRGILVQSILPGFVKTPMTAVNRFPMPFMISAPKAAGHIVKAIERDAPEAVFPFPVLIGMKFARTIPVRPWAAFFGAQSRRAMQRKRAGATTGT